MTKEERLELLRQLQANTPTRTSGEQAEIDREVAEIDATIADYNEKIIELEEKLANMDNYQYQSPNAEERDMTIELLEESFAEQLAELERSDNEYKELQAIGTSISDSYDEEIAALNTEIASLERRLRKNDVAVQRNMRMQLSPEELSDLTAELESKRARLKLCEQMKVQYVADLKDYEDLIATNNKKREIIVAKQSRLETVKKDRVQENTIDKHKLRLDQDELARLKAGVEALNSRKQSIQFDANDKIRLLIADLEKEIDESKLGVNNDAEVSEKVGLAEEAIDAPIMDKNGNVVGVAQVKNPEFEDIYSHSNGASNDSLEMEDIYSKSGDDPNYEEELTTPSDLDDEREAVVEDSDQELIEKKKLEIVKDFLKTHWKKFVAAIAVVLMIAASIRGCNSLKQVTPDDLNNELNNRPSYSQKYDDNEDKKDKDIGNNQNNNESGNNISTEPDVDPNPNPDVEPEPDIDPTPNPDVQPEPDVDPNPNPDVEPEPDIDPTPSPDVQPEPDLGENEIELQAGESVANVSDIFGNGEDVMVEHGDEIGTTLDSGVSVKDYTGDGNMIVELPTETETKVVENADEKTFHQTLEDFFGGPISITDSENSFELGEGGRHK